MESTLNNQEEKFMRIQPNKNNKKKEIKIHRNIRLKKSQKCLMRKDRLEYVMKEGMHLVCKRTKIKIIASFKYKYLNIQIQIK